MESLSLAGRASARFPYCRVGSSVCHHKTVPTSQRHRHSRRRWLSAAQSENPSEPAVEVEAKEKVQEPEPVEETEKAPEEPKTCLEAINLGLDLFDDGEYEKAVKLFTNALELPGRGSVREAGRALEYSCPSESEEHSALYNMSCCYCQMNKLEPALICLEGLFERGYANFDQIQQDPDLDPIKGSQGYQDLLGKYDSLGARVSRAVFGKKKNDTNKPWLTW